jgi:glycosyltransferase involved in cell wall biosynthesis
MVPTYNQEEYVGKAIESALAQSYDNLEVVISDDGSTDQTGDVARRYCSDPRVKYYKNEENLGRAGNYRKTLYDRASGDWVLNLDGDDYLVDHEYVEDAIAEVRSNQGLVMVVGGQRKLHPDDSYTDHFPTDRKRDKRCGIDLFLEWFPGKTTIPHLATLYNRELAKEVGFYEWEGVASDWDSLRRLSLHGDVLLMKRVVGVWRAHGGNATYDTRAQVRLGNIQSVHRSYHYAKKRGINTKDLISWRDKYLRIEVRNSINKILSSDRPGNIINYIKNIRDANIPFAKSMLFALVDPKVYMKSIAHSILGRNAAAKIFRIKRRLLRKNNSDVEQ